MDIEPSSEVLAVWLGRCHFAWALELQLAAREAIAQGTGREVLFLCEHEPVLTMGRRADSADILWTTEELETMGIEVVETPRGGEVTLHAPGQLVAYPIVYVGKKIRSHIENMASAAIAVLEAGGVSPVEFSWEHPGVWQGQRKYASIGVHVSRGIAVQGLSLNVEVDQRLFGALISCGLPQAEMSSLVSDRSTPANAMLDYARQWADAFAMARGVSLRWVTVASEAWLRREAQDEMQ